MCSEAKNIRIPVKLFPCIDHLLGVEIVIMRRVVVHAVDAVDGVVVKR